MEVPKLLADNHLAAACITFDALHCQVATLEMIQNANGVYIAQVKANQATLQQDILDTIKLSTPIATHKQHDKGHGRIAYREAKFFATNESFFEEKWQNVGFKQIISLTRTVEQQKTGKKTAENCIFISNSQCHSSQEIFETIRNHWIIEADNWVRDVTLREDEIKSKNNQMVEVLAVYITAATNLMRQQKHKNIKQAIEEYQENPILAAKIIRNKFL